MSKSFFSTSIGKKYVVAITGLFLVLFNVAHMAGNLQMFAGQDAINNYAAMLQGLGPVLWIARISLLVFLVVHVSLAIQLTLQSRAARPTSYQLQNTVQATAHSRIMALSGSIIFLYVVGHLLHFTMGVILPEYHTLQDAQGRHDVYNMVVRSFKVIPVSIAYIVALSLLWSHLAHGIASIFQTLGIRAPRSASSTDTIGKIASAIIILGYISIPLGVLSGIIVAS